jgi:hypothetical protein
MKYKFLESDLTSVLVSLGMISRSTSCIFVLILSLSDRVIWNLRVVGLY